MSKFFFPDAKIEPETLEENRVCRKIRAHDGNLMMVEVMFGSGAIGTEHRHVHEQVCYCLAGEFEFTVEGRTSRLRPGDSVYIPPSVPHGTVCLSEGRLLDIFTPQREDFLKNQSVEGDQ
ncbi:MAG: cupin domain-containing protein [Candidatus Accumulibacter sp.]|jgi:quercetin dioxygenase-like cupin family protein|nr:cupin domain-containing protein [Accumulibacter sp.]